MKLRYNFLIFILFFQLVVGFAQTTNPFQIGTPQKKRARTTSKASIIDTSSTASNQLSSNPFEIDGKPKLIIQNSIQKQNQSLIEQDTNISGNPFEINGDAKKNITVTNDFKVTSKDTSNPFSIESPPIIQVQKPLKIQTKEPIIKSNPKLEKQENLLFYLITSSLFLFTVLLSAYRSYFNKVYQTFLSSNLLKSIYQKVRNSTNYTVFLLIYTTFFFNLALFIYLVCITFDIGIPQNSSTFFIILAGVVAFFTFHHILLGIMSSVFPVKDNIGLYNFLIINFNIGMGVVLLPLNLFIAYVPIGVGQIIVYISFGVLTLLIMYKLLRGLEIAKKIVSYHKLHFFLYLCVIEIAPLLILIKYLSKLGY